MPGQMSKLLRQPFDSMADASSGSRSPYIPPIPLSKLLPAISSPQRWNILNQLVKGHPLPVCALAASLRASETSISKHVAVLLSTGIVLRHYGLYSINPRFLVPGTRSLEFGSILLRFDPPS